MDTQITFKLSLEELELIKKASNLIGLGHTTFARTSSLEKARKVLIENNLPAL
jgi:uncharacterized protein (DUF1778 family)